VVVRIAMMGSGGIGGCIGARLAEVGADVSFIARGAHLQAMRERGLSVASPLGNVVLPKVNASETAADIGPVDVVFFAVKTYDGEKAAASLRPLLKQSTRVVTLQNGIDSVETLGRHVPPHQVIAGATYISAYIGKPGEIVHAGGVPQVLVGGHRDPLIRSLEQIGVGAKGIGLRTVKDIDSVLWEKFVTLSAFSGGTALMRSGIGPILADREGRAFMEQLRDEGMSVAAAAGHPMSEGFVDRALALWTALPPELKSSMANDLDRGKPIEVAWLSGRMHELGIKLGVGTPAHTAVYRALHLHALGSRNELHSVVP
jgi:2-dehydropantoate 2-reductase